jgi:transposase
MELTDKKWALIEPFVRPSRRPDGRGRPWRDTRAVLEGVLWILRSGARWKDLPDRFPPYQTCHRRFQQWRETGAWDHILEFLAKELQRRGKLDLTEGAIDGSFAPAKKGGSRSGRPDDAERRRNVRERLARWIASGSPFPSLIPIDIPRNPGCRRRDEPTADDGAAGRRRRTR